MRATACIAVSLLLAGGAESALHRHTPNKANASLSQWGDFIKLNKEDSGLPLSYRVWPSNYFDTVPADQRPKDITQPLFQPACGYEVPADRMNAYSYQTEEMLTAAGCNIYDSALWAIALSLMGEHALPQNYFANILLPGKTVQLGNLRGDAACRGVIAWGECTDTDGNGGCGLCYGDGPTNGDKTLPTANAYFFRMISDWWAFDGTVDVRCPEKNLRWTWNEWRPVLGENAWVNLLGTLHTVYQRYGQKPASIPDNAPEVQLAVNFIPAVQKMLLSSVGGVYYAPRNIFSYTDPDAGSGLSIENNISLLAGLKALYYLITNKPDSAHKHYLPIIQDLIGRVTGFIRLSYDPENSYFRQGGRFNKSTGQFEWGQGDSPSFAVDCQTWAVAVIGADTVDSWFGSGASLRIWETTKALGGYSPQPNGHVKGLGFTTNHEQVFSGEWTLGAVNWLRVMAAESSYDDTVKSGLLAEADYMLQSVESELKMTVQMRDGTTVEAVKYANKRYYIPFGWYANPLPSVASSAWALMLDQSFNPFMLTGAYSSSYP
eukprot:TRINITY_DN1063_c0_g1_i1.p1 TRINITY_DN1063_c0_g1~~TRINITY_DN1063_c0_g1_i1.p1  ORF type:complete len:547 (-),score=116.20 TRINITY_DN1063_c0_g1_i1:500-2140(-)